jgi:tetratricopeptide (TPR) repeat protein
LRLAGFSAKMSAMRLPAVLPVALLLLGAAVRPVAAAPPAARPEAKVHYQAGADYYSSGHYTDAIREFQAAYELSHLPAILYNLARAETQLGHEAEAIGYLKRYLAASPEAPDAPSVRAEIAAREKALADAQARARAEADAAASRKQAEDAERRAREEAEAARRANDEAHRTRGRSILAYALGGLAVGVGLAAVAGGIAAGVLAEHDSSTVTAGGASAPGRPAVAWGGDVANAESRGSLAWKAGLAADVIGGALVAAGAGVLIWTARSDASERKRRAASTPSASLRMLPAPGALSLAGTF